MCVHVWESDFENLLIGMRIVEKIGQHWWWMKTERQ